MMDHEGMPLSTYPTVKALYSYNGRSKKELSFSADELLTVLDITCETWWQGAARGQIGYIPAAYVEHTPSDGSSGAVPDDIDLTPAPPPPPESDSSDVPPPPSGPVPSAPLMRVPPTSRMIEFPSTVIEEENEDSSSIQQGNPHIFMIYIGHCRCCVLIF